MFLNLIALLDHNFILTKLLEVKEVNLDNYLNLILRDFYIFKIFIWRF
jgi:hypothetical protein